MPLLTKSDGTKFGKTNGKAIWLDRGKKLLLMKCINSLLIQKMIKLLIT